MIDHAKHNTLKQCATRQCCRQESRWEQPGQSTRQPGLALLHEFETTSTTLSNQTGQASVGHGRALFLSQFSLQRRPHSKTRAKRCPGWAPDKTGPSHCHTAQCRCRSRFRYNTVMSMSLEGKTGSRDGGSPHLPVATNGSMTKPKLSTSLTSPTNGKPSKQGKNLTLAKSTTSPPLPDRPLLSLLS